MFGPVQSQHISHYLASMDDPNRLPLVVIETATGAQSISDFKFPKQCVVLVGSEDNGVPPKVIKKLRKDFDGLVYIPMPGNHLSLNVVAALTCSLYEYRRQWPQA